MSPRGGNREIALHDHAERAIPAGPFCVRVLLRRDLDEADLVVARAAPFAIVRRPSLTVTVVVPSTQRLEVGVPLTVSTPSAVIRNTLS